MKKCTEKEYFTEFFFPLLQVILFLAVTRES